MCPPGLGFARRDRGGARPRRGGAPAARYYFDWTKTAKGQRKDPPDCPFTPAVTIFMGLDVALRLIEEEGLDQVFARHRLLGRATREAVKALDLELFGPEDERANVVTAIRLPEGVDGGKVPKLMRDHYGITDRRRPEPAQGQDRSDRPLRLLRRLRHRHHARRARDDAARPRRTTSSSAPASAAAQRVFLEAGVPAGAPA